MAALTRNNANFFQPGFEHADTSDTRRYFDTVAPVELARR